MYSSTTRRVLMASTALTALVLASGMSIEPAAALDGVWIATPVNNNFNDGQNWDSGSLPTGTASFGASNTTNITVTSSATLGEMVFDAGASNYTFSTTFQTVTFAGRGIVINGGSATFNMTGGMFVAMSFWNSSTAGTATITGSGLSFFGQSSGGFANITNDSISLSNSATLGFATVNNLGSLVLFDNSTAGNATIDNHGSVEFVNASNAGSAAIANRSGSVVVFGQSSSAGFSTITNESGSTVNFRDQSTGGNATIINEGTVNFSNSTGPASDGRLSVGSIAGSGNYILGANELTVGGNDSSTTVNGVISGTGGALVKAGTGTLLLSGTNTYTGATTVDGGTLAVNGSIATSSGVTVNGGTLGGTGKLPGVVINAGGNLAPGNSIGTIAVNGDLQFGAGSFYTVEVSPAASDRTNVTGTAMLTGATVRATALPGSFTAQRYTIVSADGGLGGTQFAGLTVTGSFAPARNPHLTYDLNNAYLVLDPNTLTLAQGATRNQVNVANGINRAVASGMTPPAGFDTLLNMSGAAVGRALDQLAGESHTQGQTGAFQLGNSYLALLSDPFGTRRDGGAAPLGYASERTSAPLVVRSAFASLDRDAAAFAPRWDLWGTAFGGGNNVSGDPAGTGSRDAFTRAGAVAAGADYRFAANSLVGFSLAGGATNWSVAGSGSGSSDVLMAGIYGRHASGPAYVAAAANYANYWMSTTRTVTIAGLDRLDARFNAESFGGRIEAGYRLPARYLDVTWTPYGAIQGQSFRTPDYTEAASIGSNQFALRFSGRTATAVRAELGLHADRAVAISRGNELSLFGRAAYAHDTVSNPALAANFAVLGTAGGFTAFGAQPSQNLLLTSAGAEWRLAGGISFMVKADGEWGERSRSYSGTGRIRYTW